MRETLLPVSAQDTHGLEGSSWANFALVDMIHEEPGGDEFGGPEEVRSVEIVLWERVSLQGQAMAIVNGRVAAPIFKWQKEGLFIPSRVFPDGTVVKQVLPNVGRGFRRGKRSIRLNKWLLRLRIMWSTAIAGADEEGLQSRDCEVCKGVAVAAGAPNEAAAAAAEAEALAHGMVAQPVATCPLCLLSFHEVCARQLAISGAERGMPELTATLPEEFARDLLCALCRATHKREGLEGAGAGGNGLGVQ
jgi:hypothetical protein